MNDFPGCEATTTPRINNFLCYWLRKTHFPNNKDMAIGPFCIALWFWPIRKDTNTTNINKESHLGKRSDNFTPHQQITIEFFSYFFLFEVEHLLYSSIHDHVIVFMNLFSNHIHAI